MAKKKHSTPKQAQRARTQRQRTELDLSLKKRKSDTAHKQAMKAIESMHGAFESPGRAPRSPVGMDFKTRGSIAKAKSKQSKKDSAAMVRAAERVRGARMIDRATQKKANSSPASMRLTAKPRKKKKK